jgi:hypothetical protein
MSVLIDKAMLKSINFKRSKKISDFFLPKKIKSKKKPITENKSIKKNQNYALIKLQK